MKELSVRLTSENRIEFDDEVFCIQKPSNPSSKRSMLGARNLYCMTSQLNQPHAISHS